MIEATASSPEDVILQTPTLTYTLDGVTTVVTAVVTINPNTIGESDKYFSLQITSGYGSVTPIDTMTIQIEGINVPYRKKNYILLFLLLL